MSVEIEEIVIGTKAELIEHFNSFVKPYFEREKGMIPDVFYELAENTTIKSQLSEIEESKAKLRNIRLGMIFFIVHRNTVGRDFVSSLKTFYVKIREDNLI